MSTAAPELPAGWRPLRPGSPAYPRLLGEIRDPPALVIRGELATDAVMVAVVGARRSTAYGEEVAYETGFQLAAAGVVVVSGLARGIDAAAHRGALDSGGRTVAVMGTGPDMVYPPEHRALADRIAGSGALVTQFPVGTGPYPYNFPTRNETISGLSLGAVVVEARRRSGAMLTAGAAGNQGRVVMAFPGSVHNPASQGCHDLIRDKASLVTCAADILAEVKTEPLHQLLVDHPRPRFGDVRDDVLNILRVGSRTLDEVVAGLEVPVADTVTALARLRLDGEVRLHDGTYGIARHRPARSQEE